MYIYDTYPYKALYLHQFIYILALECSTKKAALVVA